MRKLALLIAAFLLASITAAVADEGSPAPDVSADMEEEMMALSFTYDPVSFRLFYRLGVKSDGDCSTEDLQASCTAVDVIGQNGQVNHGTIMGIFARSLAPGRGKGCLVSQMAQSPFGKGDEQVKAKPDDEAPGEDGSEAVAEGEAPEIEEDTEKPEKMDYRQYCDKEKGPKKTPPGQAKKQEREAADSES